MLPEGAVNYAAEPNDGLVRQNVISEVAPEVLTGVKVVKDLFTGSTAEDYQFTEPCF